MNLDLLFFSSLPEDCLFLFFTYFPKIELFFKNLGLFGCWRQVTTKSIEIQVHSKLETWPFQLAQKGCLLLPCGIAYFDSRKVRHSCKFSWPHPILLDTPTLIPGAQKKRDNRDSLLGDVSHGGSSGWAIFFELLNLSLPVYHPFNQSIYKWINESINWLIDQSINQLINQLISLRNCRKC